MTLLDGKKTAADIKEEIALEVRSLKDNGKKTPHLAAIIVGNNGASITYVNAKVKACERVGFESTLIRLTEEATEEELLNEIAILNIDKDIDGFIVQLPLPKHIDEQKILMRKDLFAELFMQLEQGLYLQKFSKLQTLPIEFMTGNEKILTVLFANCILKQLKMRLIILQKIPTRPSILRKKIALQKLYLALTLQPIYCLYKERLKSITNKKIVL